MGKGMELLGKLGHFGKLLKERRMKGCWKDGLGKKRKHAMHEYVIVLYSFSDFRASYFGAHIIMCS